MRSRAGEEVDHRAWHVDSGKRLQLRNDDVEAKLVIGRVDVGDQPPRQARQNPWRNPIEVQAPRSEVITSRPAR